MVLKISSITAPPQTNILQNFTDATAGRSQQLFYCIGTTGGLGGFILTKEAGVGLPLKITRSSNGITELNFDITINKPTIFAGIGSIDLFFQVISTGSGETTVGVDFELIHYDGSTEIVIASFDSTHIITVGSTGQLTKMKFNVTRKLFGIGKILRLKAQAHHSGTDGRLEFHFDPSTATRDLKITIPVVNLE